MSSLSPTQITVLLNPEQEEHALYLLRESCMPATFTVVDVQEQHISWGTVFVLTRKEKHLTLALSEPITTKQVEDIAGLVMTGLILGFVIRGDIDLGERVISNLG